MVPSLAVAHHVNGCTGHEILLAETVAPADRFVRASVHATPNATIDIWSSFPAEDSKLATLVAARRPFEPWHVLLEGFTGFFIAGTGGVPAVATVTFGSATITQSTDPTSGLSMGVGFLSYVEEDIELLFAGSVATGREGRVAICASGATLLSVDVGPAKAFWLDDIEGTSAVATSLESVGVADGTYGFNVEGDALGFVYDDATVGDDTLAGPTGTITLGGMHSLLGAAPGDYSLALRQHVDLGDSTAMLLVDLPPR